jgi:hypothetical protein
LRFGVQEADRANDELQGARVIITTGEYRGCEGLCLGKAGDAAHWAISPDGTSVILDLRFEKDFGLLIDLSADPQAN